MNLCTENIKSLSKIGCVRIYDDFVYEIEVIMHSLYPNEFFDIHNGLPTDEYMVSQKVNLLLPILGKIMKYSNNEIKLRKNLIQMMNIENRIRYLEMLPKEVSESIIRIEIEKQEKENGKE